MDLDTKVFGVNVHVIPDVFVGICWSPSPAPNWIRPLVERDPRLALCFTLCSGAFSGRPGRH